MIRIFTAALVALFLLAGCSQDVDEGAWRAEVQEISPKPRGPKAELGGTVAQQNAVRKAETYLSIMGFSRSGLIKQLEYEGFSTSDAEYAATAVGLGSAPTRERKRKEIDRRCVTGFSSSPECKEEFLEFEWNSLTAAEQSGFCLTWNADREGTLATIMAEMAEIENDYISSDTMGTFLDDKC